MQSATSLLQLDSLLGTRTEEQGIDARLLSQWDSVFVESVKHLTANGKKLLLSYDVCKSHRTLRSLSILRDGGVEVYILLTHASGHAQALGLPIFEPSKERH